MHGANTAHAWRDCEHGVHTILQACGVSACPSQVMNMPGAYSRTRKARPFYSSMFGSEIPCAKL